MDVYTAECFFFSSRHSTTAVKDEPPDQWDEEDQEEEAVKPVIKDKDLEFLHQEVVRDRSLDDYLKRDLQSKKSDGKYKEMLVRVFSGIKSRFKFLA